MPDSGGTSGNVRLQAALLYASWNWKIFPLTAYKTPFKGSHGHLDATTDAAQLRDWYDVAKPPNLGLACGTIVALDLDGSAWAHSVWGTRLAELAARHGGVPATLMQRTARGVHLLYQMPEGVTVRTRNEPRRKDAPGVDIKGAGGYIVLTPSVNFKTRFRYHWLNAVRPSIMPDWLIEFCQTIGNDGKVLNDSLTSLGARPAYLERTQRDVARRSIDASKTEWSYDEELRIRAALMAIPSDGYDLWRTVGMALWWLAWDRSDGSSRSFELFDEWSRTSREKYSLHAVEQKWESFSRNARGEVTLGTLYHLARQHGWNGQAAFKSETEVMLYSTGNSDRHKNQPPVTFSPPEAAVTDQTQVEKRPGGAGKAGGDVGSRPEPHGQNGTVPAFVNGTYVNGHAQALPAVWQGPQAIRFVDVTEEGHPKATMANAAQAIRGLGIECHKDMFRERYHVGGHAIQQYGGELSDDAVVMVRKMCKSIYRFDPGKAHAQDAATQLCLENQHDPLLRYLNELVWDGARRLDTWLTAYMQAPDTALNRAIGRITLIAAVRRARHPGCKFDQIVVLEGPEGINKSSAIEVLAGHEYFSDQEILGLDERAQQEASMGVWLHEIADLKGMKRAEINHVKAFASRKVDRARPAYGRFRVDKPRRCIYFATTNEDDYLKSDTGNRRFWPVKVGEINLEMLRRDRDQLWAEAAAMEYQHESILLQRDLWQAASVEQDERLEREPWGELIHAYVAGEKDGPRADVSIREVLCDNRHIQLRPEGLNQVSMNRAARALRALGFTRYRKREGKALVWRYRRSENETAPTERGDNVVRPA